MKNVPKLRFNEFSSEWESKMLGDFIEERSEKTEDKENYPLYSLTIENGVVPKSDRYEREFLVKKEGNFKIVEPNDFVYNPMNLRFGALSVYKGQIPVSVSGYYNVFYFKNESTSDFWNNYLKTDRMFYLYNTIATGSLEEKKRVHYSQFKELDLKIPTKEEQERIANFLTKVDKLIEKQEEKVNNLEQYKKGMIQKIFSQKIRFKKDSGGEYTEWERKNLKDIVISKSKGGLPQYSEDNGNVLLNNEYLDGFNKVPIYVTNEINVSENDILILWDGSQSGKVYTGAIGVLGSTFVSIKLNEENNNIFIYQLLNSKKDLIQTVWREGSGVPHVAKDFVENFKVKLPCLEEQTKIANFLFKIDSIVEREKEKLEELIQWKKGLLQQMFV